MMERLKYSSNEAVNGEKQENYRHKTNQERRSFLSISLCTIGFQTADYSCKRPGEMATLSLTQRM